MKREGGGREGKSLTTDAIGNREKTEASSDGSGRYIWPVEATAGSGRGKGERGGIRDETTTGPFRAVAVAVTVPSSFASCRFPCFATRVPVADAMRISG